ncbi:hypothetical protein Salat_1051200 [Sesamum alatum]|uniref:N-acetyltransferase domain-containing protein n=1 Tax=Sesamum alatum TaxID=300844 RepID=A0AAE2CSI2_9LAMI|nr:hypothetical protein Salat_1051200 [Sesamum alatum]
MASSIFVINSNPQLMLPRVEDCQLYRLNIPELLSEPCAYECYYDELAEVSACDIDDDMLTMMGADSRNELYVLLGPVEDWDGEAPTIYCAIQVCMEGKVADLPDSGGEKFSDCFFIFSDMPEFQDMPELVGVNIRKVYAREQDYANTAVRLMTRYYNGEAAEDPLPLDEEAVCAMIKLMNDYEPVAATNIEHWSQPHLFSIARHHFKKLLSGNLNSIDHSFALRILGMEFSSRRPATLTERPWSEIENRIIVFMIRGPPVSVEVMEEEIRTVADLYFDALLPISLTEVDRSLLLLCGLQHRRAADMAVR